MPTYTNDNSYSIKVLSTNGVTIDVEPDGSFETYKILENIISGLTRTADTPYYNPNKSNEAVNLDSSTIVTIEITDIKDSKSIYIWKVTGCILTVYLISQDNDPPAAILRPGDDTEIELDQSVDNVILVADSAGSCEYVIKKGF